MILLIGVFKLLKALVLLALGLLVALDHQQLAHDVSTAAHMAGVRPRVIDELVSKVSTISTGKLALFGAGSMIYGALFAVEGVGLLREKVWAEYLTTVITASFIPFEVREMIVHHSIGKAIVIAVNVAAVVYLVWKLRRGHHWPFAHAVT